MDNITSYANKLDQILYVIIDIDRIPTKLCVFVAKLYPKNNLKRQLRIISKC